MSLAGQALAGKLWVVLVTVVVAVSVTLFLNGKMPKLYEASASFYVPASPDVFSLTTETGGAFRVIPTPTVFKDQLRGYFGILTSERVAVRVAERVPARNVGQIRRGTRFRLTGAGMFIITATDRDPVVAAQIANEYADSFNQLFEEISLPRVARTREFIEQQLRKIRVELAAADDRLRRFKEKHRAVSLSEETSELIKKLSAVQAQSDQTRVSLEEVRARRTDLERQYAAETSMQVSSEITRNNPVVEVVQTRLMQLEIDAAGLAAKVTPAHPDLARLRREIEEARQQLSQAYARILGDQTRSLNPVHENLRQLLATLYAEEQGLVAKVAGLDRVIQQLEAQALLLPGLAAELSRLTRDVHHLEETDRSLALKLEDARIQERREVQTFLVVDRAKPGSVPAYPNPLLNLAAAGALGMVAGITYAMFLRYRQSAVCQP